MMTTITSATKLIDEAIPTSTGSSDGGGAVLGAGGLVPTVGLGVVVVVVAESRIEGLPNSYLDHQPLE